MEEHFLFESIQNIPHAVAFDLIRKAKTEEERNFWAYVADMNLQRQQKAVMASEHF